MEHKSSDETDEEGTLIWKDYFLNVAHAVSLKSKDPDCKVGAIMVNEDGLIVATGFNGIARHLPDDQKLLSQKLEKLDWIIHAEHNVLLNAGRAGTQTRGCTVFVTKFPCLSCLQVLIQAGIQRVCTNDDKFWKNDPLDSDHSGKQFIIDNELLAIDAPTARKPKALPKLKPGLRRGSSATPSESDSNGLPSRSKIR